MKNTTTLGMFALIAFGVGMVGINFSDNSFVMQTSTQSSNIEAGTILGHIEIIHSDSEGNILSYQQTDNMIVNDGRNCTAMLLFGANSGCTSGTATALGKYTVIGVGNGTVISAGSNNAILNEEITGDGLVAIAGALGTFGNSTNAADPATQLISNQFTYTGSQANNPISQAGLFNQTGLGVDRGVFAMKNFPSTVNMNTNDLLTVNWDITISGSDLVGP